MKWIKASDRLPKIEGKKILVRYIDTDKRLLFNAENNLSVQIDFDGYHYKKEMVEWLDESFDETTEWKEECERLAKIADHWQNEYSKILYEQNKDLPGFHKVKLDNL